MVTYNFGNIADWLSASGTIAAVITSLYLANRDNKKVANIMTVHQFGKNEWGEEDKSKENLQISIVNVGNKTIHIMKISGWLRRGFRKSIKLVSVEKDYPIDYSLKPGDKFSQSIDITTLGKVLLGLGYIRKNKKMKLTIYFEDIEGKKYKRRITIDLDELSNI